MSGSGTGAITVFQDFFVDLDFPVELTQNDELKVPVPIYNYLKVPQAIELRVEAGDGLELLDGETVSVEVPADAVSVAHFRVKAMTPALLAE